MYDFDLASRVVVAVVREIELPEGISSSRPTPLGKPKGHSCISMCLFNSRKNLAPGPKSGKCLPKVSQGRSLSSPRQANDLLSFVEPDPCAETLGSPPYRSILGDSPNHSLNLALGTEVLERDLQRRSTLGRDSQRELVGSYSPRWTSKPARGAEAL